MAHLLTEWAWHLGWRLGTVSRVFLAPVFEAPIAKTGSLSWRGSSGSTFGVTRRWLGLVMRAAKSLACRPSFLKSRCSFLSSSAWSLLLKTLKAISIRRLRGFGAPWQAFEASDGCQGLIGW